MRYSGEGSKYIAFRASEEMFNELQEICVDKETTISTLMRQMARNYIDKHNKKKNKKRGN